MPCVEIETKEDGTVTWGVCPPEEETGEPKDYMQPAASVDEALAKAKEALGGAAAQSPDDQWNQVQKDRAMANQPGGPMMNQPMGA